jgi:spermidine/putrescine transport system substrate-binding protein
MSISRRAILRTSALGAGALAMPAVLRSHDALASSGTVSVAAWGDYFDKNTIITDFEKASGIKVTLTTFGSNEEIENKLRAAGGKGFDVLFPSVDTGPNYYKDNLLQPIDEKKFDASKVIPSVYRQSLTLGAANRGQRMLVPYDWGTEAITYDSSLVKKGYGELSYADLWADGLAKKVAFRQKSVLAGLALLMDANGTLKSDRGLLAYKSEEDCKKVFDAALKFVAEKKANIGAFWNNANEATAAFKDAGCVIGQTWDTTGILLNRSVDPKWKYTMPKEGGLAWTDTLAIAAGAANVDQAYAFANYLFKPEVGAMFANATGYNSCAVGADKFLDDKAKAAFAMAYPADAIEKLWWWPMMPAFFSKLRGEYVEKITAIAKA